MNQTQAPPYVRSYLKHQAKEAWSFFNKVGYPNPKDEKWRFSNPNPWLLKNASLVPEEKKISPEGVEAAHPAFDITPNHLISAIITENGIARAPFKESLKTLAH